MKLLKITKLCVLILFLELMLIRWLSTEVNILAYLQNSILVACFLGLGMGLISPKPKDTLADCLVPLTFLSLLLSVPLLRQGVQSSALGLSFFHDFVVWNEAADTSSMLAVGSSIFIVFAILAAAWATMVPLGAELGRLFHETPGRLRAYSADIFGSLLGVLGFTLLAYLSLNPLWWTVTLILLLLLQDSCRNIRAAGYMALILIGASLAQISESAETTVWTPYQKLQFIPLKDDKEWQVIVNNSGFQQIQNNSALYTVPSRERVIQQYNIPARLANPARRALVVGAGTGNDVAGLLAHSDAEVVAVDIDPVLLKVGADLHPESPYLNPRVRRIENDARAVFFNEPPKSYDLVVFGLLDSHTTPNLSNARLDNFVYTQESLQGAKRILSDDGVLCIIFQLQRPYVANRLRNLLTSVFGRPPMVFDIPGSNYGWGGTAFVIGDEQRLSENLKADSMLRDFIDSNTMNFPDSTLTTPATTDDWPYLYIERPSVPTLFYILGTIFLALWGLSSYRRYGRFIAPNFRSPEDLTFLLLGISFSLVQVFSINKASILFGSTWFVNSVVISGVLIMILIANAVSALCRPPFLLTGVGIVALTVALGIIPLTPLLEYPMMQRALIAAVISGLPLFLSGILFAQAFSATSNPGRALGANLFGAMIGGILQLITFRFGIASTIYLAALFYMLATVAGLRWQALTTADTER